MEQVLSPPIDQIHLAKAMSRPLSNGELPSSRSTVEAPFKNPIPRPAALFRASDTVFPAEAGTDQQTLLGRSAEKGKLSPDLSLGNKMEIARRIQRDERREGRVEADPVGSEVMGSSSPNPGNDTVSGAGGKSMLTLSSRKRKKKSLEQIDRARERQRLARRAKRAAKARCGGEDNAGIEDDAVSHHSRESTLDGKGNEGYDSPDPFFGLEEDDVRRMIRLEMSTLQNPYEQGLQRVKLLHEKEVDTALATVVWFLRASQDPNLERRWVLQEVCSLLYHKSWPVAVTAMRNIAYGTSKKASNLSRFSCKSRSLELWATLLSTPILC